MRYEKESLFTSVPCGGFLDSLSLFLHFNEIYFIHIYVDVIYHS